MTKGKAVARKADGDRFKRANLTMHPRHWAMLEQIAQHYNITPSEAVRRLINEEWTRREAQGLGSGASPKPKPPPDRN